MISGRKSRQKTQGATLEDRIRGLTRREQLDLIKRVAAWGPPANGQEGDGPEAASAQEESAARARYNVVSDIEELAVIEGYLALRRGLIRMPDLPGWEATWIHDLPENR